MGVSHGVACSWLGRWRARGVVEVGRGSGAEVALRAALRGGRAQGPMSR